MEDLSEVLKKRFCVLYKPKQDTCAGVKVRVEKMKEHRKNNRREEIFEKRQIPLNMSPAVTPVTKRQKTPEKQPPVVNKRLEMLLKWKADKEKRKQELKKNQKPLFKVTHVNVDVGLPKLDKVNMEIKGKPFKSKFAPPNHEFRPPANIKPIHFNRPAGSTVKSVRKETTEAAASTRRIVTRSQTRSATAMSSSQTKSVDRPKSNRTPKAKDKGAKVQSVDKKTKGAKSQTLQDAGDRNDAKEVDESIQKGETSLISPDYPLQNDTTSSSETKTPEKTSPPVYISPFVTISRGKNSARKEYSARKSRKSSLPQDPTSPKAGAAYFSWTLNNQILRLQGLCEQWAKYKDEEAPPEEAISMIDVAIGQTNLLITKKFVQFRGLIEKCEQADSETTVTCEDLHGFWDMMYLQVVNLDKRFENLEKLRSNNWEELLPVVKKDVVKKKGKAANQVKASAGLKAAIQAARRRQQEQKGGFVTKTPQGRRSSRILEVKSEETQNVSPGLMMMKVAQYAKGVETPARSILKSDVQKSVKSHSKSVLFIDEVDSEKENIDRTNTQTKGKTPTRRSTRLTKSKLFD